MPEIPAFSVHVLVLPLVLLIMLCFVNESSAHIDESVHFSRKIRENHQSNQKPLDLPKSAQIEGDIVLGGLFPVHERGAPCGVVQDERGIQRMEAMLFAIDLINSDQNLLPDIRLGADIRDTCSSETHALKQTLHFVKTLVDEFEADEFVCMDGLPAQPARNRTGTKEVVAVVGAAYSTVSIQVANLLRLFSIPQVSYASTSAVLSDKSRFEYFARTVPSNNLQAETMADIVQHFNWTYVSTVASEGEYGEMGINAFKNEAIERNICIAISLIVPHGAGQQEFAYILERLRTQSTARVVILFLKTADVRDLLSAASKAGVKEHFVWMGSDTWGKQDAPVTYNSLAAAGALTLELQSDPITKFDDYFKGLSPSTNSRNPWFREYWEKVHKCRLRSRDEDIQSNDASQNDQLPFCTGKEKITNSLYKQESKVPFVVDAVYAIAHALHSLLEKNCGHLTRRSAVRKNCVLAYRIPGDRLYAQLLSTSFEDGSGAHVKFTSDGDRLGTYNIYNYRRNLATNIYDYQSIGNWSANSGLAIAKRTQITWADGTYTPPNSRCSDPCPIGHVMSVQKDDTCCWVCIPCQPWQYVNLSGYNCIDCEHGSWPNANRTGCYELT